MIEFWPKPNRDLAGLRLRSDHDRIPAEIQSESYHDSAQPDAESGQTQSPIGSGVQSNAESDRTRSPVGCGVWPHTKSSKNLADLGRPALWPLAATNRSDSDHNLAGLHIRSDRGRISIVLRLEFGRFVATSIMTTSGHKSVRFW